MEELSDLGGRRGGDGAPPPPPFPFSSKLSVQVYTVPSSAASGGAHQAPGAVAPLAHTSGSGSGHLAPPLLGADGDRHAGGRRVGLDPFKAKIVSHPRYNRLVAAFLDCHKVGCPPEEAEEILAAAREREARQRAAVGGAHAGPDPELDQFMESYCELLAAGKEELSRPLREAEEFLRTVESQLSSITSTGQPLISAAEEEKIRLDPSVDDDEQEEAGNGMDAEESLGVDPCSDDKELKRHLLRKYRGCLGSLRKELCKKRKKGKLPKEAQQKLLSWWELHYRWPYPSETEKIALAESTGLEQKQINNWFINQRKRHWKPSEEMQFAVMDGFHHPPPPLSTSTPASWEHRRQWSTDRAAIMERAHGHWHS